MHVSKISCPVVNERIAHLADNGSRGLTLELECSLDHAHLRRRRIKPCERRPIVHDEARTDDVRSSIHRPGHQGYLQQAGKLILVLNACFGVDDSTIVGDGAVRADEDVVGDGLSEDLDLEDVGDDFLSLPVDVWVHEGDVVVSGDDVAECRETLFDALNGDGVREGVAQVLELLVRCRTGDE
jgi:hypothetical protein